MRVWSVVFQAESESKRAGKGTARRARNSVQASWLYADIPKSSSSSLSDPANRDSATRLAVKVRMRESR